MFWKSRLDSDIGIARTTVISGLKVTVLWPTETSSFSPMGARGQRWSESHCQAAWWWGLGASSLTRITSTRDSEPPKEGGKSELLFDYRKEWLPTSFPGCLPKWRPLVGVACSEEIATAPGNRCRTRNEQPAARMNATQSTRTDCTWSPWVPSWSSSGKIKAVFLLYSLCRFCC